MSLEFEKEIIILAEARGWLPVDNKIGVYWRYPVGSVVEGSTCGLTGLPNPFKYFSADYAYLEWMRENLQPGELFHYIKVHAVNYKVGDYARAMLEYIKAKESAHAMSALPKGKANETK